ncbi:MAG: PEPxxWA-CTERM sorting domain-containing protein [Pseudomonadota bacterium]
MKAFSKFAASVAFVAATVCASTASAATIINFAQYQQQNAADTLKWTQSASKTGGTLVDINSPTVIFRIWDTEVAPGDVVDVLAKMKFNGVVDSGNAATTFMGQKIQGGLHGTFSFTSLQAFSRNGVNYGTGVNLLSGAFSGGTIIGAGTGSVNGDALAGAVVDYTSAVLDTSDFRLDTFILSLNAIHRNGGSGLAYTNGQSLKNFTATTTGQFAAAVPEPTTWALMIMGFGGAGAMLRNRRRALALA